MKKLKLPGLNVIPSLKKELWTHKYVIYDTFELYLWPRTQRYLVSWMEKNKIPLEQINEYKEIIFKSQFFNYKRELNLFKRLGEKGFKVQATNDLIDTVYKVDLFATYKDQKFFIQVKPKTSKLDESYLTRFKMFAQKHNAIPLIAIPDNLATLDIWFFWDVTDKKELKESNKIHISYLDEYKRKSNL